MGEGNAGGGGPFDLAKLILGDVPAQWIRLLATGALLAWSILTLRQFSDDMRAESQATRSALLEYIAANKAWQDTNAAERRYLIEEVNERFQVVYKHDGMDYHPVRLPERRDDR